MDEETLRRIIREELTIFHLGGRDATPEPHATQYIKEWREYAGWTVEQLAGAADIKPAYIEEAEEGAYMQVARIKRIAEALGIPPAALLSPPPLRREFPDGVIDIWTGFPPRE